MDLQQIIEEQRSEPGYSFSHSAGHLALDFINTVSTAGMYHDMRYEADPKYAGDHLGKYVDMVEWGRQLRLITDAEAERLLAKAGEHPDQAEEAVAAARKLRHALYRVFTAYSLGLPVSEDALEALNAELPVALSHMRVRRGTDGFQWGWDEESDELTKMLWPVAKSAVDLLTEEGRRLERVHQCAASDCGWLFLDMSKNRSRRWCDMSNCGNQAKARRHYHRKKGHKVEA
ncbi:MAG: ABATE domain-containing protein [Chloroflexota bacterium]|nr:ABATE domain-containing protein [Chloroflexota bacterium]MDQ5867931.1 ABATE domain-containing protein [Chloroflexota bacterium]